MYIYIHTHFTHSHVAKNTKDMSLCLRIAKAKLICNSIHTHTPSVCLVPPTTHYTHHTNKFMNTLTY